MLSKEAEFVVTVLDLELRVASGASPVVGTSAGQRSSPRAKGQAAQDFAHSWRRRLEHFRPLRFVLQHDLAEEANRGHAVVEHLVVKFLERKVGAFLGLEIFA